MKKFFALLLAVALVLSLAACGNSNSDNSSAPETSSGGENQNGPSYPKMTLEMAVNNSGSPDEACLKKFAELIEARSGGNITGVIYAGTLGSETEIVEQLRANTIHVYVAATTTMSTYAGEYNTFSVPYLYADKEQAMESWHSSVGDGMRAAWANSGIGSSPNTLFIRGFRELTSNKPVHSAEDVRGLKLRLPSTAEWVTVWSALGANVATISSSEVFSALQTGVVDAQENPIISNYNKGLQEVQKYTIMTDHIVDVLPVIFSQKMYDSLDADTQALFMECLDEATDWANQYCVEITDDNRAEMEKAGMIFIEDVDKDSFKAVAMDCLKDISANWADGVYEQVLIDVGE